MTKHSKHHHIDSAFVYGIAVLSVLLFSNISKTIHKLETHTLLHTVKTTQTYTSFDKTAFDTVKIVGKAYVVYDARTGEVLASKNGNVILPLASLTKIMTLVTARSHYSRSTGITILPSGLDGEYDFGLKNGQKWTLDELLKYTLVMSSNDGAQEIAEQVGGGRSSFVRMMNDDALRLGLTMKFTHPAGLDLDGQIGGLGSAEDMAKLMSIAYIGFPEILDATTKTRARVTASNGVLSGIPNTNQKINNIQGVLASKTGYTDIAGGNLAIIVDVLVGHPVVLVVLGSTKEDRFSDIEVLYNTLQNIPRVGK